MHQRTLELIRGRRPSASSVFLASAVWLLASQHTETIRDQPPPSPRNRRIWAIASHADGAENHLGPRAPKIKDTDRLNAIGPDPWVPGTKSGRSALNVRRDRRVRYVDFVSRCQFGR